MNKRFTTFYVPLPHSLETACNALLDKLTELKTQQQNVFKITVFVSGEHFKDVKIFLQKCLHDYLMDTPTQINILAQKPKDAVLAVELESIAGFAELDFFSNYARLTEDHNKYYWFGGISFDDASSEKAATAAFSELTERMHFANLTFNNVVRQWNYIGHILQTRTENGNLKQNYQEFNEVRKQFYELDKLTQYPAATGIGTNSENVSIEIFASNVPSIAIHSPKQTDPAAYGQTVLVGNENRKKTAPLFERARLLQSSTSATLYVSGTASIAGQETLDIDNTEKQTLNTIAMIEDLASIENIRKQVPDFAFANCKYSRVRVYVKNENDFQLIENICKKHYGDAPLMIVQADVCRDNLLVEIEAEIKYFSP